MYHATRVFAVYLFVVLGVELAQLLAQAFQPFFFESALEGFAGVVVNGGNIVNTIAHGIDIHHAAA